ncbi:asparagine synthase (glutamine-hydrolyzing) [Anaeroselena agilis]|uniref:asparagine synthase (glutamine-hydrolyzing) n=1 Tax=Anaeroselena agilis TaxID=3063788 RepID=A0ABU3P0C9_9FIRM|nr:asparagine synthase (glutamine-hydrolyzing) [Selenomonadales bacterium 4137-cl]
MCGITGWVDWDRDLTREGDVLTAMTDTLARRGPDAQGFYKSRHAALGHRRLSVVDPAGGKQPMLRSRGGQEYIITYNGELYNTADLRWDLMARGHAFTTSSDTEVLLKAYIEWGAGCVERLNGIFAFGIWDTVRQRLFLARDRLGVKPLFYARLPDGLVFASELKALLAHPDIQPEIDREGLAEIFMLGPARTPGHGVFRGIDELEPGCAALFDRRGLAKTRYWSLTSQPHEQDFPATVDMVRALFQDAVKRQLVSDVPLCTLLSGGLDSSAITAVAAAAYREEGRTLDTFSVEYIDNDRFFAAHSFQPNRDAPWVQRVAEHFATRHREILLDTPELAGVLRDAARARDLPGMADIDTSLYLFSREVKKAATVGLSGECADEVFGGYPWFYRPEMLAADTFPWSPRPERRLELLSPLLRADTFLRDYPRQRYAEALADVPRLTGEAAEDARMREIFHLSLFRWMPTLLDRKDRMSMACGLELRVPFCDHRLVEYAWNIPWGMKNYQQREKGLLRHALAGVLPDDVLWRRKSPYPKTHNPSFAAEVKDRLLAVLDDQASPLLPLIDAAKVRDFAASVDAGSPYPWFGQLMGGPQLMAYLVQIDAWLRDNSIRVVL